MPCSRNSKPSSAWPMKPTNSSPAIRSKSTSASSLHFGDNPHNFFPLFPVSSEPPLVTSDPPRNLYLSTRTGCFHCSTPVLWLALSPKTEHIDVQGEPC